MNAINDSAARRQIPAAQPFRSPEAAWFWTMGILQARRDGVGASFGTQRQVCEPDDVVMTLDRLYRQRRIDLAHARILRDYGERGTPPDHGKPQERADHRLWREAMDRLGQALKGRGIVQP